MSGKYQGLAASPLMPRRLRASTNARLTLATEFGDETSLGSECTMYSGDDLGGIAHPMQRSVAEHGVEFAVEIESFTVHHARVHAQLSRGINLRGAGIDTDDLASH